MLQMVARNSLNKLAVGSVSVKKGGAAAFRECADLVEERKDPIALSGFCASRCSKEVPGV